MTAKSEVLKTTAIERQIGETARAAKLKLRFDKVVLRLTGDLKATLAGVLPETQSVVITVTAPIKRPAKTAEAIAIIVRDGLAQGELHKTIHGNEVRLRSITRAGRNQPKVLAFVHNVESDARLILDIAESRLLGRDRHEE